jgi:hypothetical protein
MIFEFIAGHFVCIVFLTAVYMHLQIESNDYIHVT